jgi:hypothetical protein
MEESKDDEFFVHPEDFGKDGITREELEPHKVEREQINLDEQCIASSTYQITVSCTVTDPSGHNPPHNVQKYGTCTKYTGQVSGQYCYTRCESSYVICNR